MAMALWKGAVAVREMPTSTYRAAVTAMLPAEHHSPMAHSSRSPVRAMARRRLVKRRSRSASDASTGCTAKGISSASADTVPIWLLLKPRYRSSTDKKAHMAAKPAQ